MTFRKLFSILITVTFLGCNSNNNQRALTSARQEVNTISDTIKKPLLADSSKYNKNEYAFIVGIVQRNDSAFIDADYIQYLTGQAAIDAAKKLHQADTFTTKEGKIEFDVPDDYFIVNNNKKIRRLALETNCSINLVINPDRIPPITENSLQSLKKIDHESPFLLTLNVKGFVIKIKEIFVPWQNRNYALQWAWQ